MPDQAEFIRTILGSEHENVIREAAAATRGSRLARS
jgi:hypothetical protein